MGENERTYSSSRDVFLTRTWMVLAQNLVSTTFDSLAETAFLPLCLMVGNVNQRRAWRMRENISNKKILRFILT